MKKQIQKRNKTLRFRVKKALAKRKNIKQFTPTVEQCQSWFRTLNRGMFGGNLQEPKLIVRKMIYDWGLCVVNWDNRKCRKGRFNQKVIPYHLGDHLDYRIELHNKFPMWKDFIETLAHEMVHLYQMQVWKDPYSNHNANFYSWKNYFRQHNLRLRQ
jgi:hypothetical protein